MTFFLTTLFVLGLIIGSYLNVIIYRSVFPPKTSKKRSFCPHCSHKLAVLDLIPLLSYLLLRGKCRYCHEKISLRYPVTELTTGVLFCLLGVYYYNQFINESAGPFNTYVTLLYSLFVISALISLFFTDLYWGILPDSIIKFSFIVSLIYTLYAAVVNGYLIFFEPLLGSAVVGIFFFLLIFFSKGAAMGGGDMKFGFWLGFMLGWPRIIPALFIAFLTGSLLSVMLIMLGVKKFGNTIPFGPFLALGTYIAFLCGKEIIDIYLNLL